MKIKVYIAVIPCDYQSADASLCYSRDEAQDYINEHAIRGDTHYCSIVEDEVVVSRKATDFTKNPSPP
jgi:hypothetical protein